MPANPHSLRRMSVSMNGLACTGQPEDLVIRGHHGHDLCLAHRGLEWAEVQVAQLVLAHVHRADVATALRRAMPGEVLRRRRDVATVDERRRAPLKAGDRRDAHARIQIGILAVCLFDAPPARVLREIEHGREDEIRARERRLEADLREGFDARDRRRTCWRTRAADG